MQLQCNLLQLSSATSNHVTGHSLLYLGPHSLFLSAARRPPAPSHKPVAQTSPSASQVAALTGSSQAAGLEDAGCVVGPQSTGSKGRQHRLGQQLAVELPVGRHIGQDAQRDLQRSSCMDSL